MADSGHASIDGIKETDIVFDCPYCGKSLAIDYRGAGLTIPCSDCGRDVVVPIPEGMELEDIDSTLEEQEVRILNLRRSLAAAEDKIEKLEAEVAALRADRQSLETLKRQSGSVSIEIAAKVNSIRDSLEEGVRRLGEIGDLMGKTESPQTPAE